MVGSIACLTYLVRDLHFSQNFVAVWLKSLAVFGAIIGAYFTTYLVNKLSIYKAVKINCYIQM